MEGAGKTLVFPSSAFSLPSQPPIVRPVEKPVDWQGSLGSVVSTGPEQRHKVFGSAPGRCPMHVGFQLHPSLFFLKIFICLFIWLHRVLVASCGI